MTAWSLLWDSFNKGTTRYAAQIAGRQSLWTQPSFFVTVGAEELNGTRQPSERAVTPRVYVTRTVHFPRLLS